MRSRLIWAIAVIGVLGATGGLLWMLHAGDDHPSASVAGRAAESSLAPAPVAPRPVDAPALAVAPAPAPVVAVAPAPAPVVAAAPAPIAPADLRALPDDAAPAPEVDPKQVWMDGLIGRFERGQEAYRDGRWAEAADMALSVYDDIGGAQNLYYAAECYQRLGDTARADELRARYAEELRAEQQAAAPASPPRPSP